MDVATSITADNTVRTLDRLARERGAPGHVRCDNGPELTAHALRDWVPLQPSGDGVHRARRASGRTRSWSPSTRAYATSCSNVELFACLAEAEVVVADWREDYNTRRVHSALGRRTPAAFAAAWTPDPATGV